ncbi:group 1 truncated hemoglobin [Herbiconiux sp. UC225_62]|uniref:group I truncated hemoglobin n=1 Tax=Herbiconiux sp. UC225_62 TaxID=3350168 RepID=UPI0036D43AC2
MTAYDEIGGHPAMKLAVVVFYNRVVADPLLAPYFAGISLERLRAHQVAFLSGVLGGPQAFAGRDLPAAHVAFAITDGAFDRMVEHLEFALVDVGAPATATAEVLATVGGLRHAIVQPSPIPEPAPAPTSNRSGQ